MSLEFFRIIRFLVFKTKTFERLITFFLKKGKISTLIAFLMAFNNNFDIFLINFNCF
jgi:hypothetical protein